MGRIVIENLDEAVIAALSDRALARRTTVEEEARHVLREAVRAWRRENRVALADDPARRFGEA